MSILFLFILLLFPTAPTWAAITCTGQSFPIDVPTDPQSQAYTVPSVTNGITFFHAAVRNGSRTVTSATIAGNAGTQIGTGLSSTSHAAALFYRLDVASGSQTIALNWDAAPLSYVLTAVTCSPVNQSNPIAVSNTATGTAGTTITVDCAGTTASQIVLDFAAADGNTTLTRGANQTEIDQDVSDVILAAGSSSEPGGGTITMSNTIVDDDWSTFCVALNPVSSRRSIAPWAMQ